VVLVVLLAFFLGRDGSGLAILDLIGFGGVVHLWGLMSVMVDSAGAWVALGLRWYLLAAGLRVLGLAASSLARSS
jgi:hypothetical protein